jgi:hypothetical protein
MKRSSIKRFFQNKWVVPLSAMVLTLCIGSFAIAGTGSHDHDYSFIPPSSSTTVSLVLAAPSSPTSTTLLTPSLAALVASPAATAQMTAEQLALEQAKENAILDLIREKMSPDDQAVFDQLRSVAAQQQQTLSQAQAALQSTKVEITALIDKYLGMGNDVSLALAAGSATTVRINSIPEK